MSIEDNRLDRVIDDLEANRDETTEAWEENERLIDELRLEKGIPGEERIDVCEFLRRVRETTDTRSAS